MLEKVLKRVGRKLALLLAFALVINSVQNHVLGVHAEQALPDQELFESETIGQEEETTVSAGDATDNVPELQDDPLMMGVPKDAASVLDGYRLQWKDGSLKVTYDGAAHFPEAKVVDEEDADVTGELGIDIVYSVSDGEDASAIPEGGYTNAGTYKVKATAEKDGDGISADAEFVIEKAKVEIEIMGDAEVVFPQLPGFSTVVKGVEGTELPESVKLAAESGVSLKYYHKNGEEKGDELGPEGPFPVGEYLAEAVFEGTDNMEGCTVSKDFVVISNEISLISAFADGTPVIRDDITVDGLEGEWLNRADLYETDSRKGILVKISVENVDSGVEEVSYHTSSMASPDYVILSPMAEPQEGMPGAGEYKVEEGEDGISKLITFMTQTGDWKDEKDFSITVKVKNKDGLDVTSDPKTFNFNIDTAPPQLTSVKVGSDSLTGEEEKETELRYAEDQQIEIKIIEAFYGEENKPVITVYKDENPVEASGLTFAFAAETGSVTGSFNLQGEGEYYFTVSYADSGGNPLQSDSYTIDGDTNIYTSPKIVIAHPELTEFEVTEPDNYVNDVAESRYEDYYEKAVEIRFSLKERDSFSKIPNENLQKYFLGESGSGGHLNLSLQEADALNGVYAPSSIDLSRDLTIERDSADGDLVHFTLNLSADSSQNKYYKSFKLGFTSEDEGAELKASEEVTKALEAKGGVTFEKGVLTYDRAIVIDMVPPTVSISYEKVDESPIDTMTYRSESGDGSVPYTYFDAEKLGGLTAEQLYLVIEVEEELFSCTDFTDGITASRWDFENAGTKSDFSKQLHTYLTNAEGVLWETDGVNPNRHRIRIPLSQLGDWTGNTGEYAANGRYDISLEYQNIVTASIITAETHMVYDTSKPEIEVDYGESVFQRLKGVLSKVFWFFKDKVEITITATDTISDLSQIEVYDTTYSEENYGKEGEKSRLNFTIDFSEDPNGELKLETATNPDLQEEDVTYDYENGEFKINVSLGADFRGNLNVAATNKAGISTGNFILEDTVMVADNTSPVLEEITYPAADRVLEELTGTDVTEERKDQPYLSEYRYYYWNPFEVSFQIKEEYLMAGQSEIDSKNYELTDLLKVELLSSDTWDGEYEPVPGFTWDIQPVAGENGVFKVTFNVGDLAGAGTQDGHYKFVISVTDHSGNKMAVSGRSDSGYAAMDYDAANCTYTSPVLTIDTVAPVVTFEGYYRKDGGEYKKLEEDSREELFKLLTYGSDPGYAYFNQSTDQGDDKEFYLKLQIKENNFRGVDETDFQTAMRRTLLDGSEIDESALFLSELTEKDASGQVKWQTDASDQDAHFLYVPLKDVFDQGHYDLEKLIYQDMAGHVSTDAVTANFVYDTVEPEVEIVYGGNVITRFLDKVLSKLFAFYKDVCAVTITVKDDAAGSNVITVSDVFEDGEEELEEYYGDDATHLFFTLDYSEEEVVLTDKAGTGIVLTDVDGAKSGVVDGITVTVERQEVATTIQFEVPAEFRGKIQAQVEDKAKRRTETHMADIGIGAEDAVMVVDDTSPVLDAVSITAAIGPNLTDADNGATVQEAAQKPLSSAYRYYYQTDEVSVNFDITEVNFCEAFDLDPVENFGSLMELVEVKLYQYDDAAAAFEDASRQEITDFDWSYQRVEGDIDTYRFSFALPKKDGHYRFTITAQDYSGHQLVLAQNPDALGNVGGYTGEDFQDALYTSPMLTIDTVKPTVSFGGYYVRQESGNYEELKEEQGELLKYASEAEANQYTYFNQTGNVLVEKPYLKLVVEEHNFRGNVDADFIGTDMVQSWLDGTRDTELGKKQLVAFLETEENWLHEGDVHTIYIPLADFGEARFDVIAGYVDLAGNIQDELAEAYAVYDQTCPVVANIKYDQTFLQKVVKTLHGIFWFFGGNALDKVQVTITVEDKTAGSNVITVTDDLKADAEDGEKKALEIIGGNYDQHVGFTIDYSEDGKGTLTYADGKNVEVDEFSKTQQGDVTTITFSIPSEFRGTLRVNAQDKSCLESGNDHVDGEDAPIIAVVDRTKPVLEKITNSVPRQVVDRATLETMETEGAVSTSQNWYFYDGGINVNFDITEANLFNNTDAQEGLEEYFKDIVTVELYHSEILDADPTQYKSLGQLDFDVERKTGDKDTYVCSFSIPADLGDGHYYYTISAVDYSSNILGIPSRTGENAISEEESGYRDDDFNADAGIYTSPVLTIDTTNPVVEVQFVNEKGESQGYTPTEHEYYNGQYTTIELTVREHNFRPSDVSITMSAADVNGKADEVSSVINANAWIEGILVGLRDNLSSVWVADPKDGDVYTARIQIQSPQYDANYTFGISYRDMAVREAGSYIYNGKAIGGTPIMGDVFTVDSVAPVITVIENSDDSDMRYHDVNTGGWAKFLNYVTFGYFWKQAIRVTLVAHDEISGVRYFDYNAFLTETDAVSKQTDVVSAADVEAENMVQGNNVDRYVTFTLSPDFKGDVIASAEDFAANRCANQTLKGVILESAAQHASEGAHVGIKVQTTPSRVVNGVNYYSSDVNVLFSYEDNYSGLNQVTYTLANSGENSKSYVNENGDITYSDQLSGVVSAEANNSNDVLLTAAYTDNAGYSGGTQDRINIDVTAPVISVVYDTYNAQNENYYNTVRTATVTITERNFNEGDVKFTITNTDGVMPIISGWSHSAGNGVSDSTTHTCTVAFAEDGDYTFTLECQDFAGNHSSYGVVDEFTIDRTVPEISVSYDNMDSQNAYYYNAYRRATVNILEHNFNPSDVTIEITAENDGESVSVPAVNGWSSNGDMNTATIYYDMDAEYTFDISYMDMAGNVTEEFPEEHFIVDTIAPELEITNIENYSANKGTVQPHIIYSDVNMGEYAISLNGYHNGNIPVDGMSSSIEIHNGAEIVLDDLEDIRANDDLYTLRAEVVDLAGNMTSAEVMYSVNRWGSVFILSDDTLQYVNDYYHNQEKDLVVTEINVDTITSAQITYSERSASEVVTLEENDYSVESSGGRGTWKQNVYTIFGDNFAGDGQYSVRITSTDAARNEMSNVDYAEDEDAEALLQFVIDKTNPFCTITGVEDGEQYNEDMRTVTVTANDNFFLDTLQIILDGSVLAEYDADTLMENGGKVTQEIGSSNRRRTLEVVATDKAGNISAENVMTFLITTNLFYQFINNTTAVVATASIVGLASIGGIVAAIVKANMAGAAAAAGGAAIGSKFFFLLFGKKKKKEEEEGEEGEENKKG